MRTLSGALVLVIAFAVSGCPAKATRDDCAKACDNVNRLYLGAVEKQSGSNAVLSKMGEAGAKMAQDMASLQLDFLRQECEQECMERATRDLTECLSNAKSPEDLERCE
ncbi:MAG: hypothetical protein EP329_09645 [Deltaproteobacteria bacterium]|nr:MAG: hypothetical protein EP329_09645 [Deltaproteobacteria bacterium]